MKFKCIGGPGGIALAGRDVYPGDVFELDERTGRSYVASGRAVVIEEPPAPLEPVKEKEGDDPPAKPKDPETKAKKKE